MTLDSDITEIKKDIRELDGKLEDFENKAIEDIHKISIKQNYSLMYQDKILRKIPRLTIYALLAVTMIAGIKSCQYSRDSYQEIQEIRQKLNDSHQGGQQ